VVVPDGGYAYAAGVSLRAGGSLAGRVVPIRTATGWPLISQG
jgi:hypothetical protein